MIVLINFHRSTLFHPVQLKFFELVCEMKMKIIYVKINVITPASTADIKP